MSLFKCDDFSALNNLTNLYLQRQTCNAHQSFNDDSDRSGMQYLDKPVADCVVEDLIPVDRSTAHWKCTRADSTDLGVSDHHIKQSLNRVWCELDVSIGRQYECVVECRCTHTDCLKQISLNELCICQSRVVTKGRNNTRVTILSVGSQ